MTVMASFLFAQISKPVSIYMDADIRFQFRDEDALVRFIYASQNLALPEDARVFRDGDSYLVTRELDGINRGLPLVKGSWEE